MFTTHPAEIEPFGVVLTVTPAEELLEFVVVFTELLVLLEEELLFDNELLFDELDQPLLVIAKLVPFPDGLKNVNHQFPLPGKT